MAIEWSEVEESDAVVLVLVLEVVSGLVVAVAVVDEKVIRTEGRVSWLWIGKHPPKESQLPPAAL